MASDHPIHDEFRLHPSTLDQLSLYGGTMPKRVIAFLIDMILLALLGSLASVALVVLAPLTFGATAALLPFVGIGVPFLYFSLMIASERAASLGMQWLDLRVYALDGGRPSLVDSVIRTGVFIPSMMLTGGLIALIILFSPRNRGLHDFLAGTVVVSRSAAVLVREHQGPVIDG